ncbi:hypothetical protein WN51_01970 [Melipona quadrifasciata]|uniref:Uncharacterized protein n=1 Tax=Melipona quadrifasciata TaxID=166423 RepID=A0A0N0U7M0_9HYME|nr:hypothetical protein WN51_01970 [Melipona quadrifasciata]
MKSREMDLHAADIVKRKRLERLKYCLTLHAEAACVGEIIANYLKEYQHLRDGRILTNKLIKIHKSSFLSFYLEFKIRQTSTDNIRSGMIQQNLQKESIIYTKTARLVPCTPSTTELRYRLWVKNTDLQFFSSLTTEFCIKKRAAVKRNVANQARKVNRRADTVTTLFARQYLTIPYTGVGSVAARKTTSRKVRDEGAPSKGTMTEKHGRKIRGSRPRTRKRRKTAQLIPQDHQQATEEEVRDSPDSETEGLPADLSEFLELAVELVDEAVPREHSETLRRFERRAAAAAAAPGPQEEPVVY